MKVLKRILQAIASLFKGLAGIRRADGPGGNGPGTGNPKTPGG